MRLAAASASAAGVDYLPTIGQVPTYTKFQPTADPGKNASDYFQPYWYAKNANDNGGTHIQAHGGQVVKVGDAYYWYGEDRSNGYDNSPGVHAYMSTDLYNWTDLGVALRAVTSKSQLTDKSNADYAYFDKAYNLTKSDGSVDAAKPTQSSRTSTPTPIRMVMARLIPYRHFRASEDHLQQEEQAIRAVVAFRWKHHAGRFQLCTCTCGRGCFRQSGGPVHYGGCLSFA